MIKSPKLKDKRPEKKPQNKRSTVSAASKAPKIPARRSALSLQGIELNSETARNAIILSEIIGPPAAKRRRKR